MIKVFVLWSDNDEIIDQYGAELCIQILNLHNLIQAYKINVSDLNKLSNCSVLIIAGGEPYKLRSLIGGSGVKEIRNFISNGGSYIGICAGAVLAVPKAPTLDLLQYVKISE